MFKTILVLCAVSQLALAYPGKIIGGAEAQNGQFPAIVSLQDARSKGHFCGGGLISDRIIISAGHCFVDNQNPANTLAYVGSVDKTSGGTYYELSRVVVHENFNMNELFNDITLLQTAKAVVLSSNVQPIKLPSEDINIPAGTIVTAIGWGTTRYPSISNPRILNYVDVGVVTNTQCSSRLSAEIDDGQICVGGVNGKGLCFGDSGSPLVHDNTTIGIVSWGNPCGIGYPDVFTRVSSYLDWINKNKAILEAEA